MKKVTSAYLIGIKGVGMTAIAVYLKEKGYQVSGSDIKEIFPTDEILSNYGIIPKAGFRDDNIKQKFDLVVVTGAHGGMTNPEAIKALRMKIPVFMHGQFLGKILNEKKGIS